ncbi:MAG TPA: hypothetical protein VFF88_09765, partial [Methylocella sp.]|nr:hypothetical protein [Methylocella sp.]
PDYRINYYPVFRLAPTDDRQAERAAEFLIKNRAQAIWVIEDVSENNLYSHYLVQELVRQIHAKGLHQEQSSQVASSSNVYKARNANAVHERVECSVTDTRSPARKSSNACAARRPNPNFQQSRDSECCVNENERSRVLLWTTNRELIPIDSLKAIDIDWIFFAGSPANCLILTRQIKELYKRIDKEKNPPGILLGNACASLEMLEQSGEDLQEAFLTHPMAASDFNEGGFEDRGIQASQLLEKLIRGADDDFTKLAGKSDAGGPLKNIWFNASYFARSLVGMNNVGDARNAIRAYMEQAVNSDQPFMLHKQRYTFDKNGTAKELPIHVWRVERIGDKTQLADIEKREPRSRYTEQK